MVMLSKGEVADAENQLKKAQKILHDKGHPKLVK